MSDYQIADRKDSRALSEFLQKEGQFLLPIVSLIETAQVAIDEVIDVAGRATLEAVLQLSAQEVAGEKHPGQARGAIRWHGQQSGVVPLSNRKLRVNKPRLRHKEQGEVEVPAYRALQTNSTLASRMLDILLHGVSTRRYRQVLPAMAQTVGVSKSPLMAHFGSKHWNKLCSMWTLKVRPLRWPFLAWTGQGPRQRRP